MVKSKEVKVISNFNYTKLRCGKNVNSWQDFLFKRIGQIRVWNSESREEYNTLLSNPQKCARLLACSSSHSICVVATNEGFACLKTDAIHNLCPKTGNEVENFPVQRIPYINGIKGIPDRICINSIGTILAVCVQKDTPSILLYDIRVFTDKNIVPVPFCELKPCPSSASILLDMCWNPSMEAQNPYILTTVSSCGTVMNFQISDGNNFVLMAQKMMQGATCASWSPRGKQVVVGMKDASLIQLKPDLVAAKKIDAPTAQALQLSEQDGAISVCDIQWLSTTKFFVTFKQANSDLINFTLVVADKGVPVCYSNFEDPTFSSSPNSRCFMNFIQSWGLLACTTPFGVETVMIGGESAGQSQPTILYELEENARAELPAILDNKRSQPVALGATIDLRIHGQHVITGANTSCAPMPILYVLSSDGLLCPFYMCSLSKTKEDSAQLYVPYQGNLIPQRPPLPNVTLATDKNATVAQPAVISPEPSVTFAMKIPTPTVAAALAPSIGHVLKQKIPEKPVPIKEPVKLPSPVPAPQNIPVSPNMARKVKSVSATPEQKAIREFLTSEVNNFEKTMNDFRCEMQKALPEIGTTEELISLPRDCFEQSQRLNETIECVNKVQNDMAHINTGLNDCAASIKRISCKKDQSKSAELQFIMRQQPVDPNLARSINDVKQRFRDTERKVNNMNNKIEKAKNQKSIKTRDRELNIAKATAVSISEIVNESTKKLRRLNIRVQKTSQNNTPVKAESSLMKSGHESMNSVNVDLLKHLAISSNQPIKQSLNTRLKEALKNRTTTPLRTSVPDLKPPNFKWPVAPLSVDLQSSPVLRPQKSPIKTHSPLQATKTVGIQQSSNKLIWGSPNQASPLFTTKKDDRPKPISEPRIVPDTVAGFGLNKPEKGDSDVKSGGFAFLPKSQPPSQFAPPPNVNLFAPKTISSASKHSIFTSAETPLKAHENVANISLGIGKPLSTSTPSSKAHSPLGGFSFTTTDNKTTGPREVLSGSPREIVVPKPVLNVQKEVVEAPEEAKQPQPISSLQSLEKMCAAPGENRKVAGNSGKSVMASVDKDSSPVLNTSGLECETPEEPVKQPKEAVVNQPQPVKSLSETIIEKKPEPVTVVKSDEPEKAKISQVVTKQPEQINNVNNDEMDEMIDVIDHKPTNTTVPVQPSPSTFSFAGTAKPAGGLFATTATTNASTGGFAGFGGFGTTQTTGFGAPTTTTNSGFGGASPPQTQTQTGAVSGFGATFGGLGAKPNPENASKNVFGGGFNVSNQGSSALFGGGTAPAANASPFGGSSGFGNAGAQPGFGSATAFGSPVNTNQSTGFGSNTSPSSGGGSAFGGGAAPTTGPGFGASPAFGTTSAFGGGNSGGGSPFGGGASAFGGGSAFGSSPVASNVSPFGGGAPSAFPRATSSPSGGFAAFANQGTGMTFGSLAATPAPSAGFGGGSSFGSPQDPNKSSAFSQWR